MLENDNVKKLWDFSVQRERKLEHNKSGKQTDECNIIDIACLFDPRVKEKEQEKVER